MDADIIIIGAGASGLLAARELADHGLKIIILEAQNRIGGRIHTFPKELFGFPAEAGAEFVHGDLPLTLSLIREAGLTLQSTSGQLWNTRNGELKLTDNFIPQWDLVTSKLREVKEDIPIGQFLEEHFSSSSYRNLYDAVRGFVEGYDAADPDRASTFALRDEWMNNEEIKQYRIKEGYSALLDFLKEKCVNNQVNIKFDSEVVSINHDHTGVQAACTNGKTYKASKAIITVPVSVLEKIVFNPPLPSLLKAASEIGFGKVIKFLFRFTDQWWMSVEPMDLNQAGFIFSNETVPTWWTQHPENYPVLTGWLSGPKAEKYIHSDPEGLLDAGLSSLSGIFKIKKEILRKELTLWRIINWASDPYAAGAYAYATPATSAAREVLNQSFNNTLFFTGEALYAGKEMGTVEAALASGLKTAEKIRGLL